MRPLRTAGAFGRTATNVCFHTSAQSQVRRPWVHTKKRPAEPQIPPSWRPFEVPEVVLDLDSWDSGYARPYDNAENFAQQKKWGEMPRIDATWRRIKNFEFDRQRVSDNFAKVAGRDYWRQRWTVTDLDIMTTALRGTPKHRRRPDKKRAYGSDADGILSSVAFENAIPMSTFQDEKSFLSWLLHRKTSTLPIPRNRPKISQELISKQGSLKDLRRYVLFLLQQSNDGPWHVHRCNEHIARVLFHVLSQPEKNSPTLLNFLPFFNNLFALYQKNGWSLGPELCGACLILSAQAFQLRAAERFLEHGLKQGYWVYGKPWISDVEVALKTLHRRWDKEARDNASSQGAEVYHAPGNRSSPNSHKETLARLLAGDAGDDGKASFKAVVESNPGHEGLHEQFSRLVDRVGSLPDQLSKTELSGGKG
ncbi:methylmalonate-semialdehyde dehydrogenase [Colletotrichum incanum]|uniref:Methylmalonate-semialdehyde dehydrogenase n=1 Tax=Colletotrichum incanum TaxID=1573173 RepID=A0A167C213_COLIC|nr:methylmalonate-semialdehyde dehydrogenase [Colletotrichum incanum]